MPDANKTNKYAIPKKSEDPNTKAVLLWVERTHYTHYYYTGYIFVPFLPVTQMNENVRMSINGSEFFSHISSLSSHSK